VELSQRIIVIRPPYEYQSQYRVGVLLAQSRLKPGVLALNTERPDFVVRVHDMPCGVEVKRPRSLAGAKRLMKHAAEQIEAARVPGVIVVDVSSIVRTNSFILPRPGVNSRAEIMRLQGAVSTVLSDFITGYPRPEKFGHTMALLTFARFHVWTTLTPPTSDSGFVFTAHGFPRAYARAGGSLWGRTSATSDRGDGAHQQ
jgi:hypothetical protein